MESFNVHIYIYIVVYQMCLMKVHIEHAAVSQITRLLIISYCANVFYTTSAINYRR
jgi:hypothetical protein